MDQHTSCSYSVGHRPAPRRWAWLRSPPGFHGWLVAVGLAPSETFNTQDWQILLGRLFLSALSVRGAHQVHLRPGAFDNPSRGLSLEHSKIQPTLVQQWVLVLRFGSTGKNDPLLLIPFSPYTTPQLSFHTLTDAG